MPEPLLGLGLPEEVALNHHLQHNHFPPVNPAFVPIAQAAIEATVNAVEACDESGNIEEIDWQALDAVVHNNGTQNYTVRQIMDGLHLWDFVSFRLAAMVEADLGTDEPKAGE